MRHPWSKEKRRVRMHLRSDASVEGILDGRSGGHYRLLVPKIITADATHEIDCRWMEIPAENVVFYEVHS